MIPDEAVEAAAKALYELGFGSWENAHADTRAVQMEDMRAALEAAAPYIAAQALREAADAWREYLPAVAGYGNVQPVPVWLERRAEWVGREPKPS